MPESEQERDPLKIVLVGDWLTPRSVTKYSLDLASALMERGHTIRVICPGGERVEAFRSIGIEVETRKLMSSPLLNVPALKGAVRSLTRSGVDIVHALSREPSLFGSRLAESCGVPCVATVHRFDSSGKLAVSGLIRIITVSEALREFLVNEHKVPKEKIDVVPNGVKLADYRACGAAGDAEQVPVVASLGRLEPMRGFEYFVKAAKTVLDSGHRVQFVIVGTGDEERKLRDLVSMLGLTEHFTFVTGPVEHNRWIESFDIVVTCPVREGFGMITLEAMACGKPLVASAVGGIYTLVKDGENGLLVPPKDSDAIAERVITLLRDREEAARLGRNARAAVEENFTIEIVAEKTENTYRKAMEGRPNSDRRA